jgi:hypothetical protein
MNDRNGDSQKSIVEPISSKPVPDARHKSTEIYHILFPLCASSSAGCLTASPRHIAQYRLTCGSLACACSKDWHHLLRLRLLRIFRGSDATRSPGSCPTPTRDSDRPRLDRSSNSLIFSLAQCQHCYNIHNGTLAAVEFAKTRKRDQTNRLCDSDTKCTMTTKEAKESILSIKVNAALVGHDLGPFEPVEVLTGGYKARCRRCNQSA